VSPKEGALGSPKKETSEDALEKADKILKEGEKVVPEDKETKGE
jgi:hypothetical protein